MKAVDFGMIRNLETLGAESVLAEVRQEQPQLWLFH
jgi:hypothetical protein